MNGRVRLLIGGLVMRAPGDWLSDAAVAVSEKTVTATGSIHTLQQHYPDAEVLGSLEHLVLPGLVNAHHHAWGKTVQALGGEDDFLERWLAGLTGLPDLPPYLSTLAAAMRLARGGITTVVHSEGSGFATDYRKEMTDRLKAYRALGLRVAFAPGFTDTREVIYGDTAAFLATLPAGVREQVSSWAAARRAVDLPHYLDTLDFLIETFQRPEPEYVKIVASPLAPCWTSDGALEKLMEFARTRAIPLHTHLLESLYQREWALRTYRMSQVAHFAEMGILGPDLSCAHSVWVTEDDIRLLADHSVTVVTNPSSNLRLRSGIAPILPMLSHGVIVALGMDGNTFDDGDDIFQELRLLQRLHRLPGFHTPSLSSTNALATATTGGARWPGHPTGAATLMPGQPADVALVRHPALIALAKSGSVGPDDALISYGSSRFVTDVIVAGDIIFRNGAFPHIDEAAMLAEMNAHLSQETRVDESAQRMLVHLVRHHIEAFYRTWETPKFDPWYTYNSRR
jgi:5-methylthioadenosine/S-adenosylhomocysteine deaminase